MIGSDKSKALIRYDLEKLIGERDLGEIQNFIKLKKQDAASPKKDTEAFLIQTTRGVWIIDTEKQNIENLIDHWESNDLKYHTKMTGDLIEIDGQTFKISPGDGGSVKSALAVSKILYDYNFSIDSPYTPEFETEEFSCICRGVCFKTFDEHHRDGRGCSMGVIISLIRL